MGFGRHFEGAPLTFDLQYRFCAPPQDFMYTLVGPQCVSEPIHTPIYFGIQRCTELT